MTICIVLFCIENGWRQKGNVRWIQWEGWSLNRMGSDHQGFLESGFCWWSSCSKVPMQNLLELQVFDSGQDLGSHLQERSYAELPGVVWPRWGEPPAAGAESDGNEDEDQIDEIITDIGRECEVGCGEQAPPLEVQNFYRLISASDEKVHNGTDVTVLQAVTHLMTMKLKYNLSNQCYNDIVNLITDLILTKHNMLKELY
jgi:hypothetical protein